MSCHAARDAGRLCASCGAALLPPTRENLERLIDGSLKRRLELWERDGSLTPEIAAKLRDALASSVPLPVSADVADALEQGADRLAASIAGLKDWKPDWAERLARRLEEEHPRIAPPEPVLDTTLARGATDDLRLAADSGQALFARGDTGALGDGLASLAALDDERRGGIRPLLNEYVWWFIGALLVLGGSIMGVREAWRALGGAARQLIVGGALFGYHAAFVALGLLVARRSRSAGKVLGAIGLGLLPVVFVGGAALLDEHLLLGVLFAGALTGATFVTLRLCGRLYDVGVRPALALALLPTLAAELPLLRFDEGEPWRWLLLLVGPALLHLAPRGASLAAPLSTLWGALALAVFACVTADAPLVPGGLPFAAVSTFALALGAAVARLASEEPLRLRFPRASV
ncbi:MAG: hypothetical protein ACK4N5_21410, partial [Myxococcales bacterium]